MAVGLSLIAAIAIAVGAYLPFMTLQPGPVQTALRGLGLGTSLRILLVGSALLFAAGTLWIHLGRASVLLATTALACGAVAAVLASLASLQTAPSIEGTRVALLQAPAWTKQMVRVESIHLVIGPGFLAAWLGLLAGLLATILGRGSPVSSVARRSSFVPRRPAGAWHR